MDFDVLLYSLDSHSSVFLNFLLKARTNRAVNNTPASLSSKTAIDNQKLNSNRVSTYFGGIWKNINALAPHGFGIPIKLST